VDIEASLDPQIPLIRGDREKLKQVWLNLLNNAFESIGREGVVRVKSRLCPQGNHVLVSVADTGSGISTEDMEKVFEPFFSTKAPGVGTGLGLSVSLGIVQEHQGKILAASPTPPEYRGLAAAEGAPRPGALFTVILPVNWESPVADSCEELEKFDWPEGKLAAG
jgi:signal transduction histidine kinase